MRAPLNLAKWIDEHRDLLKPPVGNAQIWEDGRLHRHAGRRTQSAHRLPRRPARRVLLPAHGRHGAADHGGGLPARHADSRGRCVPASRRTCAIRRSVPPEASGSSSSTAARPARSTASSGIACSATRSSIAWRCSSSSIVRDLPPLFERFYGDASLRKCPSCGAVHPGQSGSSASEGTIDVHAHVFPRITREEALAANERAPWLAEARRRQGPHHAKRHALPAGGSAAVGSRPRACAGWTTRASTSSSCVRRRSCSATRGTPRKPRPGAIA